MKKIKEYYYMLADLCRKYIKCDKLILWLITFAVHLIIMQNNQMIVISPDEFNTLALPSYLTNNPIVDGTSTMYHGWEMGILYTPFFIFCKDGFTLYRCMLILNGIIASFIPVIAHSIMKRFFKYESKAGLFFISLIAGIAPNNLFMSKFVWNETMVMFLTWFIIWLFLNAVNSEDKIKKIVFSALTGAFCAFGFGSHGRLIALCATIVIILIAYKLIFKKLNFNIGAAVCGFAVLLIIDKYIKGFVINNILTANIDLSEPIHNTILSTLSYMFESFRSADGLFGLFRALIGDIFYDVIISYATVLVGAIIFFNMLKKCKTYVTSEKKNEFIVFAYGFVFLFIAICITVLFHSCSYGKDDVFDYIYGRYTENIAVLCMVFSIYYAIRYGIGVKNLLISGCLMAIFFGWVYFMESDMIVNLKSINIFEFHMYTFYSMPLNYDSIFADKSVILMTLLYVGAFSIIILYLFFKHKKFLPLFLIFLILYIPINTGNLRLGQMNDDNIMDNEKILDVFHKNKELSEKKYFYSGGSSYLKMFFYGDDIEFLKSETFEKDGKKLKKPENKEIELNSFIITYTPIKMEFNCDKSKLYFVVLDYMDEEIENFPAAIHTQKVFVYGDELAEKMKTMGYELSNDLSAFDSFEYENVAEDLWKVG